MSPDKSNLDGKWKKKKGPAPPRPLPPKRQVKKLPRKAVNNELMDIGNDDDQIYSNETWVYSVETKFSFFQK